MRSRRAKTIADINEPKRLHDADAVTESDVWRAGSPAPPPRCAVNAARCASRYGCNAAAASLVLSGRAAHFDPGALEASSSEIGETFRGSP
jgi:hypothetical protein